MFPMYQRLVITSVHNKQRKVLRWSGTVLFWQFKNATLLLFHYNWSMLKKKRMKGMKGGKKKNHFFLILWNILGQTEAFFQHGIHSTFSPCKQRIKIYYLQISNSKRDYRSTSCLCRNHQKWRMIKENVRMFPLWYISPLAQGEDTTNLCWMCQKSESAPPGN